MGVSNFQLTMTKEAKDITQQTCVQKFKTPKMTPGGYCPPEKWTVDWSWFRLPRAEIKTWMLSVVSVCWKFNSVWDSNIPLCSTIIKGIWKWIWLNLSFLRNNQANDYLGTKTHLLITLKAPADCSIQPTLTHVPEWSQPQRLALILVFSTISLFRITFHSLTKYH